MEFPILNFHLIVENTTVIISTPSKKYTMRIYRQGKGTKEGIMLEIDYINYLIKNGIPVPTIIKNKDGEFLTKTSIDSREWFSILMDFVGGEHPKHYSKNILKEFAATQAKMHELALNFKSEYSNVLLPCDTNKEIKDFLYTDLLSVDKIELDKIKSNLIKDFIIRAKDFSLNVSGLPLAINQKDIHGGNLLIKDDKLSGVLDFNDLFNGPIVISIGFFLWDIFAKNKNLDSIRYYISEYNKLRKLSYNETKALKDMLLLRNYIMGTVEFLVGGDEINSKFMFPITEYVEMEKTFNSLSEEAFN